PGGEANQLIPRQALARRTTFVRPLLTFFILRRLPGPSRENPRPTEGSARPDAHGALFPLARGTPQAHNDGGVFRGRRALPWPKRGSQPMWATLALSAALMAPSQKGTLELKNVRMTRGILGQERTDTKLLPGDVFVVAFDIDGLKVKE